MPFLVSISGLTVIALVAALACGSPTAPAPTLQTIPTTTSRHTQVIQKTLQPVILTQMVAHRPSV